MADQCASCGAPVVWVVMESGARMPLDPPQKRVVIIPTTGKGRVMDTHVSHFATCPNAAGHRKNR